MAITQQARKKPPTDRSATFRSHRAFESLMLFCLISFFFFLIVSLSSWLLAAKCYLKNKFSV